MKIIILLRILWTGGAQKIAIQEAKELTKLGHEVEIVFLRGSEFSGYSDLLREVRFTVFSESGDSILSPFYNYITRKFAPERGNESRIDFNLIRSFWKYLEGKNIDYLICHDQFAGLAGYYTNRKLGIKYSVFMHERVFLYSLPILGKIWFRIENKVLRNAVNVFSISDRVGESTTKCHNVMVETNLPGMDLNSEIKSFQEKEDSVICSSMWDYGRRPIIYLNIINEIKNFKMYVVGNWRIPELKIQFQEAIKARGLENRVIIKSGITETELILLFQRSKFCFRFGWEAGIGTSSMEAIQQGLPLITNEDLGIASIIQQYSAGLVVKEIDSIAIKNFIEKYNDAKKYDDLRLNIIALSKKYSWANHARILLGPL